MRKSTRHAYVLIALLVLTWVGILSGKPLSAVGRPKTDFSGVPLQVGGWYGIALDFDEATKKALPTCSLMLRDYARQGVETPVELTVVYGTDLGDFHQPEWCLQGNGLTIDSKRIVKIKPDGAPAFDAVAVMTSAASTKKAFLFWFTSRGHTATFLGSQKWQMLMERLVSRKVEPSAMVRISVDITDTEDQALSTIEEFASKIHPYLMRELTPDAVER